MSLTGAYGLALGCVFQQIVVVSVEAFVVAFVVAVVAFDIGYAFASIAVVVGSHGSGHSSFAYSSDHHSTDIAQFAQDCSLVSPHLRVNSLVVYYDHVNCHVIQVERFGVGLVSELDCGPPNV